MKHLQLTKQFAAGLVAGLIGVSLFSFIPGNSGNQGENVTNITVEDARSFFTNYMSSASPLNEVMKGVAIDENQLDAMNRIKNENPLISSFRIYFGKDNAGNNVGMVVGVSASGSDLTQGTIYSTPAWNFNTCPVVCDAASQITSN